MKQLTFTFPKDAVSNRDTLSPFWSPPKRFPEPLQFSSSDPTHLSFIKAAAMLRAEAFQIPVPDSLKNPLVLAEAVDKVTVPEFLPKRDAHIVSDLEGSLPNSASFDDDVVARDIIRKLERFAESLPPGFQMNPIQFEKVSLW